jgi:hypothetical protein
MKKQAAIFLLCVLSNCVEKDPTKSKFKLPEFSSSKLNSVQKDIPNGKCYEYWWAKTSCRDRYGGGLWAFGMPNSNSKDAFEACQETPGCAVNSGAISIGEIGQWECFGTPICTDQKHPVDLCEYRVDCTCDPGYKYFLNECAKIVCDNQYVEGERGETRNIENGSIYKVCQKDGSWRYWTVCRPGFTWADGKCQKYIR